MASRFIKKFLTRKVLVSTIAFLSLPVAVIYTSHAIDNQAPPTIKAEAESFPRVNVMEIMSEPHQTTVQAHGEAKPHFELTLRAQVTGTLIRVDTELERGQRMMPGQVMAAIDPIQYQQQKAAASLSLAEANLAYQQERREAERAGEEWLRAGLGASQGGKASSLLLRKPQKAVAQARVDQSKAMLKAAIRDLDHTQIRAPFESIIVNRHVTPGQYVQAGDKVATIYSLDRVDIQVSLPINRWNLLPKADSMIGQNNIILTNTEGHRWRGEVTHVDRHIDRNTRQRSIVVSVFQPYESAKPLLPGTFLSVTFPGVTLDGLFAIPARSLSSNGEIWFVTDQEKLSRFSAKIAFQKQGILYINNPFGKIENQNYMGMNVLVTPNASFVAGQSVEPMYSQEVTGR